MQTHTINNEHNTTRPQEKLRYSREMWTGCDQVDLRQNATIERACRTDKRPKNGKDYSNKKTE